MSCAKALIRRGLPVTMLDVGETLDEQRESTVAELAGTSVGGWRAESVHLITDNPTLINRAIPKKLVFGSDYIYGSARSYAPMECNDSGATPTYARGGYSVAWGGAMLPAADCDMNGWPIRRADLAESYTRVLSDLPVSARSDLLAREFPIYSTTPEPLEIPHQATELLADLDRVKSRNGPDIVYGQARLAVRAKPGIHGNGCSYCGLCLSGCVYGAIHNLEHDVQVLNKAGRLHYRPGLVVERLDEVGEEVRVIGRDVKTGNSIVESFDRVFVAAGAINTTRIMLQSLDLFDQPVRLKDSQKFVVPFLRRRRTKLQWPNINALAALFMELKLPQLSNHWIHMQISTVNELVLRRLGVQVQGRSHVLNRFLDPAVERLMVAWCGLHSDHSSSVELRLLKQQGRPLLRTSIIRNPASDAVVSSVCWALVRLGLKFHTLFLAPFRHVSAVGGGNHIGGSFPMSDKPSEALASDLIGRPAGLKRVHLVDGSVLPSIPGTTVALVIMANADRIAVAVPLD